MKPLILLSCSCIIDNNDISSCELEKKDGRVNRKIGDIVGVSRTTIWQWKQVRDNASEQQLKALSEGKNRTL